MCFNGWGVVCFEGEWQICRLPQRDRKIRAGEVRRREDQREMGMRVKAGRNRWSRVDESKKGDVGGREGARLKHKDKAGGRREGTEKAEGRR